MESLHHVKRFLETGFCIRASSLHGLEYYKCNIGRWLSPDPETGYPRLALADNNEFYFKFIDLPYNYDELLPEELSEYTFGCMMRGVSICMLHTRESTCHLRSGHIAKLIYMGTFSGHRHPTQKLYFADNIPANMLQAAGLIESQIPGVWKVAATRS